MALSHRATTLPLLFAAETRSKPGYNGAIMARTSFVLLLAMTCVAGLSAADDDPRPVELELRVTLEPNVVVVDLDLMADLPADAVDAIPTGATVRVSYPIRVRSRRRAWFDDRIWRGDLDVTASFDAVTGRYTCVAILDGAILERREVDGLEDVVTWLTSPPSVRISMPERYADNTLRVRSRAVFSRSTTWLIFPSVDSTRWVEIELPPQQADS